MVAFGMRNVLGMVSLRVRCLPLSLMKTPAAGLFVTGGRPRDGRLASLHDRESTADGAIRPPRDRVAARMPRRCQPPARRVRARGAARCARPRRWAGDEPEERARVEALARHPRPHPADPGGARLRPALRRWCTEELGRPASRRTSSRHAAGRRRARCSTCTVAASWRRSTAFQVRYITRLAARASGARVVLPDYPLAPEHSWRDSHEPIVELAARWAAEPGGIVLVGDSSGGGYALAVATHACATADVPQATHLRAARTLGRPDDEHPGDRRVRRRSTRGCSSESCAPTRCGGRARPTTSAAPRSARRWPTWPGCRRALMFCGTRDLLVPGCRLLARRAAEAGWPLTVRRAARPDPRLPGAAVPPRGAGGVPRRRWRSWSMTVRGAAFDDLDATTAYDVWRLRQQVFVVEQGSPYPDLDGRDREPTTRHLLLRRDGALVGVRAGARRRRLGAHRPGAGGAGTRAAGAWPTSWSATALDGHRRPRGPARRPDRTGRLVRVVRVRGHRAGVRRRRRHPRADVHGPPHVTWSGLMQEAGDGRSRAFRSASRRSAALADGGRAGPRASAAEPRPSSSRSTHWCRVTSWRSSTST